MNSIRWNTESSFCSALHYDFTTFKTSADNDRSNLVALSSTSDEVHRIVPLGFTLREAKAWYLNHVLFPRLRPALLCLAASLLAFLSLAGRLGESFDYTLSNMILLHFLFIATGFLTAYAVISLLDVASCFLGCASIIRLEVKKATLRGKDLSPFTFVVAGAIVAFWHSPVELDAAAANGALLTEMRLALVIAGGLVFVGFKFLTRNVKMIAPIVAAKAMGLYGMFLLSTPVQLYVLYPISEQATTGVVLLVLMLVLDFTLMPMWLYNYFGRGADDTAGMKH